MGLKLCRRFIPAPAGNTRSTPPKSRSRAVHPRACGEHTAEKASKIGWRGSSPRLRGTRRLEGLNIRGMRFIPAPAGNTPSRSIRAKERTVHPRACGEHWLTGSRPRSLCGSSPRLRGTRMTAQPIDFKTRFIPAPAGNTPNNGIPTLLSPVHPRACGEHRPLSSRRDRPGGSSPRLRGTHPAVLVAHGPERFIPAPAGNTKRGAIS